MNLRYEVFISVIFLCKFGCWRLFNVAIINCEEG